MVSTQQARARVYTHYPTGSTARQAHIPAVRAVKNLGWLLRHAAEIVVIDYHVEMGTVRFAATGYHAGSNPRLEYTFICDWSSAEVCKRWLARHPSLAHVTIVN